MKIALTGVTGLLGEFCALALDKMGAQVTGFSRSAPTFYGERIEWQQGELDCQDFSQLLEGKQALVHAAFAHQAGRYRGGEGKDCVKFWQDNAIATLRLLEQAKAAGVSRVILFSSRAVYANRMKGLLNESVPPCPDTHYGAQKALFETWAQIYSDSQFHVTCLRPTGVYGTRQVAEQSKWAEIVRAAQKGQPPESNRLATEVYAGDVAQAVQLLLHSDAEAVSGRTFNLSDIELSRYQLYDLIREQLGLAHYFSNHNQQAELLGPKLDCSAIKGLSWKAGGTAALRADLALLCKKLAF